MCGSAWVEIIADAAGDLDPLAAVPGNGVAVAASTRRGPPCARSPVHAGAADLDGGDVRAGLRPMPEAA